MYHFVLNFRIAKERVHLAYKHPELLLDLMKKGIISTSLACNDLEVNINVTISFYRNKIHTQEKLRRDTFVN